MWKTQAMLLQMNIATLHASTWAMCMEPHAWQTDKNSSLPKLTAGQLQTDALKHILVPCVLCLWETEQMSKKKIPH